MPVITPTVHQAASNTNTSHSFAPGYWPGSTATAAAATQGLRLQAAAAAAQHVAALRQQFLLEHAAAVQQQLERMEAARADACWEKQVMTNRG